MKKFLTILCLFIFLFSSVKEAAAEYSIFRNNFKRVGASNYSISGSLDKITNFPIISKVQVDPILDSEGNIYFSLWNDGLWVYDKSGNFLWKSNTAEPTGSPAFDSEGNLYFCAGASILNPYVYSFTKGGQKRWGYSLRPPGSYYSNACSSSPAFSPNKETLYVTVDWPVQSVMAFNLDGTVRWESKIGYTPSSASITVADDGTLYVGTTGSYGKIFALNPNGSTKWSYNAGITIYTPVIGDDGNIYFSFSGNPSGIISLTPQGVMRWKYYLSVNRVISFKNNTLYAFTNNQVIALDATNGSVKWLTLPH